MFQPGIYKRQNYCAGLYDPRAALNNARRIQFPYELLRHTRVFLPYCACRGKTKRVGRLEINTRITVEARMTVPRTSLWTTSPRE
jgi:hypothetical protein